MWIEKDAKNSWMLSMTMEFANFVVSKQSIYGIF